MIMNALNGAWSNLANHHPARITKADKDFANRLDFKDIKFTLKIIGIQKIGKNNSIGISLLAMKIKKTPNLFIKTML